MAVYIIIHLGDNAIVIAGSALRALEGLEDEPILSLIKALDNVPDPLRLEVVNCAYLLIKFESI